MKRSKGYRVFTILDSEDYDILYDEVNLQGMKLKDYITLAVHYMRNSRIENDKREQRP